MEKVLVCCECEHPIGNYHWTEIGLLCDECYLEITEEHLRNFIQ